MLWLIILVAKTIDSISSFIHAVIDMRRSLYERSVTPRMFYYQGFYNWTNNSHGIYIRLANGKFKLVRTFPTSSGARDYLNHQVKKYLDDIESTEPLYAEAPSYEAHDYKVFPSDRITYDTSCQRSKDT